MRVRYVWKSVRPWVCVRVCVAVHAMCVRETHRLLAKFWVFETRCAPGATHVIYQTGASAWKYSFLSFTKETLCVCVSGKVLFSPTWIWGRNKQQVGGDMISVAGCTFCLILLACSGCCVFFPLYKADTGFCRFLKFKATVGRRTFN